MTTTLAELVATRRAELGMSLRDVADASGGLVSKSNAAAVEAGRIRNVTDDTLDGLAVALGISDDKIRLAAGVSTQTLPPFKIPPRANRLNDRERRLVLNLIDTLLAAHRR